MKTENEEARIYWEDDRSNVSPTTPDMSSFGASMKKHNFCEFNSWESLRRKFFFYIDKWVTSAIALCRILSSLSRDLYIDYYFSVNMQQRDSPMARSKYIIAKNFSNFFQFEVIFPSLSSCRWAKSLVILYFWVEYMRDVLLAQHCKLIHLYRNGI